MCCKVQQKFAKLSSRNGLACSIHASSAKNTNSAGSKLLSYGRSVNSSKTDQGAPLEDSTPSNAEPDSSERRATLDL